MQESETECVAENKMSSFGFLGFVVASINAVVNVANNINDNNNNRNNNNNDNNNNQINTNIANSMNDQESMSMAMTGRGIRILDQLKYARDRVWAKIQGEPESNLETEEARRDQEDSLKRRRQVMEAEVLATMEKMYKEQQEKKAQTKEDEKVSEYPREIIDMLGKLYKESKQRQKTKRSERNSLHNAIKEAKKEEKAASDLYEKCRAGDSLIYSVSLVALAHLTAWDMSLRDATEDCIECIYDEVDTKSEKMGQVLGQLSRHLTKGAKNFIGISRSKSTEKIQNKTCHLYCFNV